MEGASASGREWTPDREFRAAPFAATDEWLTLGPSGGGYPGPWCVSMPYAGRVGTCGPYAACG